MQLSGLRYLLALDRERHFARAAAACHVTQPSLSAGIAALEQQLGRRLVERDRRFIGLTGEGRAILPWARQVVAAIDGLVQAAQAAPGPLTGELRLGAIPASMPAIGMFATELARLHPQLRLSISSHTSREIAARLAEFALDAGLTYVEHEPPSGVVRVPLYSERMLFVRRATGDAPAAIGWDEALAQPLCLLHQGMQNRRILDANLAAIGHAARPAATADSYVALLALVASGGFATIMPDSYAPLLPAWAQMIAFDVAMPASAIGLIVADRTPLGPMALAALAVGDRLRDR
ncbi:LysR family transcriptional regulator [Sphingomonas baiyangensis]|uniref:LysR family transcriptional regulator n=1 Tax=Sphingomonas baiyangensis TaxID=2572576 RepID=A0A4U1L0S7_9SPHN|nr:LysR family transcriptional regulator [Sphingomonas baiyangensis]TKD50361.1 LysR family transcriptional regulator [Sphingomonas baiyangensis]